MKAWRSRIDKLKGSREMAKRYDLQLQIYRWRVQIQSRKSHLSPLHCPRATFWPSLASYPSIVQKMGLKPSIQFSHIDKKNCWAKHHRQQTGSTCRWVGWFCHVHEVWKMKCLRKVSEKKESIKEGGQLYGQSCSSCRVYFETSVPNDPQMILSTRSSSVPHLSICVTTSSVSESQSCLSVLLEPAILQIGSPFLCNK